MTLDIITHPLLDGVTHGFFGRQGGASSGVFGGLNCGFGSSDQHEIVAINRGRVAAAMGAVTLASVHQVHSAEVVTVDSVTDAKPQADGIVTATPGVALSVLTADCLPVLFADPQAGVIGAAHAGWKGAIAGILSNTVTAMETLGASRDAIRAVIGPSISQKAYEVGPEFYDSVLQADPRAGRFFVQGAGDRLKFDLPAFGLAKLKEAGLGQVDWTRHCTYADRARFFSYRRATHAQDPDYGRQIAVIRL